MNIIAYVISGLGLFFIGIKTLSENMKRLAGRSIRKKISRLTKNPFIGVFWGIVFISFSQSTSAATFILISSVKSGLMKVKNAFPVIIGINVFSTLTIVLLVIDLKVAFYYLFGISALLYTGNKFVKFKNFIGVLLGIGFLFIGLFMLQDAVTPISTYHWFSHILEMTIESYSLSFLVGIILNVLTQSTLAVAAILLSLHKTGLFSLPEMMMILYGSCLGSSIIVIFLSHKLSGTSKQVAMFQIIYNFAGAFILIPLFYIEIYFNIPLYIALVKKMFTNVTFQIPAIIILFDCTAGLILFPLRNLIYKIISKFCPEPIGEKASKPKFITKYSMEAPEIALDLVEKEQIRQLEYLSYEFNLLRDEKKVNNFYDIFEGINNLSLEIHEFIIELMAGHSTTKEVYNRINQLLQVQNYLERINENISSIIEKSLILKPNEENKQFINTIIEAVDAVFITLLNVAKERDYNEIVNLELMTSGTGKGPSLIRNAYIKLDKTEADSEQINLLSLSNRCERIIWLFKSLGRCYRNI